MNSILCALLLASAPVIAQQAAQAEAAPVAEKADSDAKGKEELFDPAQLVAVFDKLFPAQPDPLPQRLALSRITVRGIFPDGTYAQLMDGVMDSFVDRIMDLSEADFGAKGKDGKPPSKETLRQQALKDDPHFEERMRITERVFTEELGKMARTFEPKLREGLARFQARGDGKGRARGVDLETGGGLGHHRVAHALDGDGVADAHLVQREVRDLDREAHAVAIGPRGADAPDVRDDSREHR